MPWFYLSFASASDFLGACVVEAADSLDAPLVAHARGCNPGGEVLVLPTPDELGPAKTFGELTDAGMRLPEDAAMLCEHLAMLCEHLNAATLGAPTCEEWAQRFAFMAADNILAARGIPAWPANYDRAAVLASIEDATGTSLSANDPLPDSLIALAQELGLIPAELRMWIHDQPARGDWSLGALRAWAAKYELGTAAADKDADAIAKDEGFIT